MSIVELLLIAVGLSMDAFAVAICKGLSMRRMNHTHALLIAVFFGFFQALMPLIGWILGRQFHSFIQSIDHWISFGLLLFVGGKMIWEAFGGEGEGELKKTSILDVKELFMLAVATSIDAFAVGITIALTPGVDIILSCFIIGVVTLVISYAGVCIGKGGGKRLGGKAEIAGGIVLILIGIKILLEHLHV